MERPGRWLGSKGDPPTLLLFLAGMLVSNIGRNAYFVCITWIVLTWTNSVRVVTVLLFTSTLAQFLSSGISGYAADVTDRRRLSVSLDIARAVVVMLTGFAIAAEMDVWVLFLSVALFSVADRGYLTAMQSMIPDLSRHGNALAANSASYLMMQAGTFLGALLAGTLLHVLPYGVALSSVSIIFVLSAAILCATRTWGCNQTTVVARDIGRVKRFISMEHLNQNGLIAPTICYCLAFGVGILINALLAAYVLNEIKGDALLFGQMESVWAFGAALACLVLSVGVGRALVGPGLPPLLLLSGMGLILLWIYRSPSVAAITLAMLGILYNLSRIILDVQAQQTVDVAAIGRTRGAINTVATGFGLLIYALIGIAGDTLPPSDVFVGYGLFVVVAAAGFLLVASRDRAKFPDGNGSA